MEIIGIKTPIFEVGQDLTDFVLAHIPSLEENSILVITSKIVALAEGRVAKLADKNKIIRQESKELIKTPFGFLTRTSTGWCINAGIDESNAETGIILLPSDPYKTAEQVRTALMKKFRLKKLGVLITDTKSLPLRVGTVGRALGLAGFEPLRSYVNKKDIFGRVSRFTESNVADALAAAAVVVMGEGNERIPLAVISNPPVVFVAKKQIPVKLSLPPEVDIFRHVFAKRKKK